jgi:hypothetical protein
VVFNSDEEEKYYNIEEDTLMESYNLESHRDQLIKTFKPGNLMEIKRRHLPNAPGTNKVLLWTKNKPSKKRVKMCHENLNMEVNG